MSIHLQGSWKHIIKLHGLHSVGTPNIRLIDLLLLLPHVDGPPPSREEAAGGWGAETQLGIPPQILPTDIL